MTIDEAIEHCKEQAKFCSIQECSEEHLQLAEWLEELKKLKNSLNATKICQVTLYELIYEDDYHGHDIVSERKIYSRKVEVPEEMVNVLRDLFHHINVCNRLIKLDIQYI